MTDNELKLCKELKEKLQAACSQYEFAQAPMAEAAPWMQDAVQKVMDTLYANDPAWVSLDREKSMIIFTDDNGFDIEYIPLLPVLFKEISPEGTYELKVGDNIIGKIVYKGMAEPPESRSDTIHIGAITEIEFYEKTEMVTIDIDLGDDKNA